MRYFTSKTVASSPHLQNPVPFLKGLPSTQYTLQHRSHTMRLPIVILFLWNTQNATASCPVFHRFPECSPISSSNPNSTPTQLRLPFTSRGMLSLHHLPYNPHTYKKDEPDSLEPGDIVYRKTASTLLRPSDETARRSEKRSWRTYRHY